MKIGLFFGSYNPIHIGHLILAQAFLNETDLDQVWLVVSPHNPHKDIKGLLSEYDRLYMCELATANQDNIRPTNVEFRLPRPSYTIDTLTFMSDKYRNHQFCLLMGEDNLVTLHKWKNAPAIIQYYPIYVYPRLTTPATPEPASPTIPMGESIHRLATVPYIDISATMIRQMIRQGRSVRYLLPEPVFDYITSRALYVA
jgi:nicotinate-nucleotide adenylyltransferase